MDSSEVAARHQAKLDALVAEIPQDRIERYVPQIKILERQRGALDQIMIEPGMPGQEVFEEAFEKFMTAHPPPPGTADMEVRRAWIEKHEQMIDDFFTTHPEIAAERDKIVEKESELAEPTNIAYDELRKNFIADGGTNDQFNALCQAVLDRKYSRPLPPTLQPALG